MENSYLKNSAPEVIVEHLLMNAPGFVCTLIGENFIYKLVNKQYQKIFGNRQLKGLPIMEALPELKDQGIETILKNVYHSGETFLASEMLIMLSKDINTPLQECYFNFSYQPMYNEKHDIYGVLVFGYEVTELVISKKINTENLLKFTQELEEKVAHRTIELEKANNILQLKNQEISFSKYNKLFLKQFSERFGGYNNHNSFFDSLVEFISDFTKLDYVLIGKVNKLGNDNYEIETISYSEFGKLVDNIRYDLADGPCAEIIADRFYSFPENCQNVFPKNKTLKLLNVEGYIGYPLFDSNNEAIGLIAVLHKSTIEDVETTTSILKILAKRIEIEFERIKSEAILEENNKILELKNKELESKNIVLKQKNIEVKIAKEKLLSEYSRSLIEASLDPLVTISLNGKITDMNNAMEIVTGNTREELTGSDFSNYFTEPDKAREVYQEVFLKGFVTNYPLTIKDHKLTDVLFNGSVYKDENNIVIGAVVVARDITEQKKVEQDLLEYKHLFNENFDFACIANADGYFEVVNKSFEKVLGYSEKELLNNSFLKYIHPDDVESTLKEIENLSNGKRTLNFINRYKKKNGDTVLLDWKANFNKITNKIYAIARDITEQKEAEQKLLNSIKEISDYKFALDAATIVDITDNLGNLTYVNQNFEKISQYSADELIGFDHSFINSNYHTKEFMSHLWATISNGKIWKNEIKNRSKNGDFYWVNSTIIPFLNQNGTPNQYVAISIDITAQKKQEQELTEAKVFAELATSIAEEAQTKAEEAVKSKQQFLSNMSHEIRTPMNAIIGFTKVMFKTELTLKQKEYITAIKMSGDALIVLINDILDLAKVDSGKMTFEQAPFKLSLSIAAMLHLFETKIQEKNLELITEYDPKIPEVLLGDSIRLNQIILNLVSNAVKFTTNGKITVNIRMLHQDDKKVILEFAISDTGIGIPAEKLNTIFENFQQASSGTSRLYGGTGLGLAIVKQLVEAQNGTIHLKSKINEGSTFSFVLTFDKTNAEAILDTEIIELDTDLKDIKILVVEDMPLNQLLMKTLLDDFGFESDITANGKKAIEKLETKQYDIILMDLQMPEMNGFEATDYIRNTLKSEIPIIALTADVTTVDLAKCKAVGMNDYIAKPVDERLLYSKIVSFMKKPIVVQPDEILTIVNDEIKIIKYTDLNFLLKKTKSDPKLMMEMIQLYLEQTPPLIIEMKNSFQTKNWKLLQASVHKMIPSFSIMGIHNDFELMAQKIQEFAHSKEMENEIQDMVNQLEMVLTQSCKELETEFTTIKNANHGN